MRCVVPLVLCQVLFSAPGLAQALERQGGRVGLSLLGGVGLAGGAVAQAAGLGGVALRFGGAFTDRFHLLGELTLAASPAGELRGLGDVVVLHPALSLLGEGYIGPRVFLRGGIGVGWATATTGNTWYLPLPGPRLVGGLGYVLWRQGERQFSLSIEVGHTLLTNTQPAFERLTTVALHAGFDWY